MIYSIATYDYAHTTIVLYSVHGSIRKEFEEANVPSSKLISSLMQKSVSKFQAHNWATIWTSYVCFSVCKLGKVHESKSKSSKSGGTYLICLSSRPLWVPIFGTRPLLIQLPPALHPPRISKKNAGLFISQFVLFRLIYTRMRFCHTGAKHFVTLYFANVSFLVVRE